MDFLITAIKIIFLLGFLIIIHEGGHFLVAKLCKVRVNEFSIGFGPKLWSKQGKETKYELRLIPFGGFVNMEGEEEHSEKEGSFSKASIPKRFAIVVAGALVNILFGILIIETPSIITAFSLTFMFALILLFYGTEKIAFLQKLKYFNITNTGAYTFSGVINIILAIIFFILPLTSTIAINYIIAFYLIVDGITLFIEAINMKKITFLYIILISY